MSKFCDRVLSSSIQPHPYFLAPRCLTDPSVQYTSQPRRLLVLSSLVEIKNCSHLLMWFQSFHVVVVVKWLYVKLHVRKVLVKCLIK